MMSVLRRQSVVRGCCISPVTFVVLRAAPAAGRRVECDILGCSALRVVDVWMGAQFAAAQTAPPMTPLVAARSLDVHHRGHS